MIHLVTAAVPMLLVGVLALVCLWLLPDTPVAGGEAMGIQLQASQLQRPAGPDQLGFSAESAELSDPGGAAIQLAAATRALRLQRVRVELGGGLVLRAVRGSWTADLLRLEGGVEIHDSSPRLFAGRVDIVGTRLRFPGQLRLHKDGRRQILQGADWSLAELLARLR